MLMNFTKRRHMLVAVLAISTSFTAVEAQERGSRPVPERSPIRGGEIDLRPKFEKGQQIRYKLELTNSSASDAAAKPARPSSGRPAQPASASESQTRSKVEMTLSLKVEEVSGDGIATVQMVFDALKVATNTGDMEIEFDSSKPSSGEDDIVATMLKNIVGSALTMKVDRNGNISSVTGGESFMALGQVASGSSSAGELFGPIFSGNPAKGSAKVGESWEYSDRLASGLLGDFKMITRHTLRGLQGRDAQIAINGRIEPNSEAGSSHFQVKNSSYTGTYLWDTAKGQLSKMDTAMSVRLEGKVAGEPMSTRNESTVKITRIPDRP